MTEATRTSQPAFSVRRLIFVSLCVWLALILLNSLRASYGKPSGFGTACWSGWWRSETVGIVSGQVTVKLPIPLPQGGPFQAEAVVYYNLWCPYRPGQFARITLSGELDTGGKAGAGSGLADAAAPSLLSLKGRLGEQSLEYAALLDSSRRGITGGYLSLNPGDSGCFALSAP